MPNSPESHYTFLDNHSPLELLLSGAGLGAGGYSAIRLLDEAMGGRAKTQEEEAKKRLQIDMPAPMIHPQKIAEEGDDSNDNWVQSILKTNLGKTVALGAGIPLGALAANKAYKAVKNYQVDSETDKLNKERMHLMQRVKSAGATPAVDALCEGLASALNKEAAATDNLETGNRFWDPIKGAVGDVGEMVGIKNHLHDNLDIRQHEGERYGAAGASGRFGGDTLSNALIGILLASGAIGGGALIHAHNKKREDEQQLQVPAGVDIVPHRM